MGDDGGSPAPADGDSTSIEVFRSGTLYMVQKDGRGKVVPEDGSAPRGGPVPVSALVAHVPVSDPWRRVERTDDLPAAVFAVVSSASRWGTGEDDGESGSGWNLDDGDPYAGVDTASMCGDCTTGAATTTPPTHDSGQQAMAKWTAEKRRALPLEDFGDPSTRTFPIEDQDDIESAKTLVGKAKDPSKVRARLIAIAKRLKLTIPDAWKPASDAAMAVFSADIDPSGGDDSYVIYENAKLFESGVFDDKNYSMTPEELWAAVEQFDKPVSVDLEHIPTVLDGKLGEVRAIRLSDDGHELRGTVAIPRWLDGLLEEGKRKVSASWDRGTKTLRRLAIVNKPRVADAALMAAFCDANPNADELLSPAFAMAHATPHGQMQLQQIHDMAATCGAVCDPANSQDTGWNKPNALFVSGRERSGMQKIHDLTAKHGAKCSIVQNSGRDLAPAAMSEDKDEADLAPAPAPTPTSQPSRKESRLMSMKEKFRALFGSGTAPPEEKAVDEFLAEFAAETVKAVPVPTPPAPVSFADSPEAKAMALQIAAAEAKANAASDRMAAMERETKLRDIATAAAAFADDEIKKLRALPNERPNLVAMFTQAALDDLATPTEVTFAAGEEIKTGTRIDAVRAMCAARPTHNLFMNMLRDTELPKGSALFAAKHGDEATKTDDAAVAAYLSHSDIGRAALALKAKNGSRN